MLSGERGWNSCIRLLLQDLQHHGWFMSPSEETALFYGTIPVVLNPIRCVEGNFAPGKQRKKKTKHKTKGQKPATAAAAVEMDQRNLQQDFQDQLNDVLGRFQSKNFFQSDLDIAFFAVFFIFIGMILLLLILVLIRCCCCCCCQDDLMPRRQKRGVVNMALEP
ncbi:hypothetical protein OJAV_G00072910 [Oryzias javanicus]|uniref:Small integral membrane protein 22 n=1 Tax=Oryzias javanicus TaxID=123683 RepID=A0A3S2MXN0_ORYJA|nr:hypothetical protein OJAV_G00072910 [Oryzias javanicus]